MENWFRDTPGLSIIWSGPGRFANIWLCCGYYFYSQIWLQADKLQLLLSRQHKFVFIKTRKTASTSLEIFFSRFCSEGDIVTTITPADEVVRLGLGGCLPQNYSEDPDLETAYRDAIRERDIVKIEKLRYLNEPLFWNHITLSEARKRVSIPDDYLVISSDRHPYDKVLSITNYRLRSRSVSDAEFNSELNREINRKRYRNIDAYRDVRGILDHRVIRYERLTQDLSALCRELNLPFDEACLPVTKSGYRLKGKDPFTSLDDVQKRKIAKICREEFEAYEYAL